MNLGEAFAKIHKPGEITRISMEAKAEFGKPIEVTWHGFTTSLPRNSTQDAPTLELLIELLTTGAPLPDSAVFETGPTDAGGNHLMA